MKFVVRLFDWKIAVSTSRASTIIMPKRAATDTVDDTSNDGRKRTKAGKEKEDGAETRSEPPHLSSSSEAVNSQSSRKLMALLFKTLDQKKVDYVDKVNAFLVGLLHKED